MKTRKLLLSALLTLGIVMSCAPVAMTADDPQEDTSRYTKSFVKHRDKTTKGKYDPDLMDKLYADDDFAEDTGYRNNRAIYSSSSGDGKTGQQSAPSNLPKSKGKAGETIRQRPRKVKNVTIAAGVCQSIDIRNDISNFEMLRGCRTIEGFLQILLMDNATEKDFQNLTFPELREITEYLLVYHVKGLRTLHKLFPNLEVIRGDSLFTDYAFAVYEVKQLREIGLTKLTQISRGGVRIEFNHELCYADTVDWNATVAGWFNVVKSNGNASFCAGTGCPAHCPGGHCWTATECQKTEKPVCHHLCLVDCFGQTDRDCYVCKTFRHEGRCLESCPKNLLAYRSRRCVTEAECLKMPAPRSTSKVDGSRKWRALNGECLSECPRGYSEEMDKNNMTICRFCHGPCQKNATGAIIRHISDLQTFRGATVIQGALEIAIRNANPNIMKEFTEALGSVEEITSFLKITHSFPLTSLEFFKSLRVIRGNKVDINNSSLVIVDNPNLSKLFPESQKIEIQNGRLFFHYNPKLCFKEITRLATMVGITNFSELEIQPDSNGDKVACDIVNINISVQDKGPSSVNVIWDAYKPHEDQKLINYILSYIQTENENVNFEGNACGRNDWQILDVGIPLTDPSTPVSKIITDLKPYTSYAVYVKTLSVRKKDSFRSPTGQSKMMLFRTAADIPTVPMNVVSTPISDSEILVKWGSPEQPNGPIAYYIIRGFLRVEDEDFLSSRDYCKHPVVHDEITENEEAPEISFKILVDDPITCCKKEHVISKELEIYCYDNMTLGYQPQSRLNYCPFPRSTNKFEFDESFSSSKSVFYDARMRLDENTFMFNLSANNFSHTITQLRHHSLYTISVAACGATLENGTEMCSPIQYTNARTKANPKADQVDDVRVHVKNDTLVTISWQPVKKPNGLTVAYVVEYTNLIVKDASKTTTCLPKRIDRAKRGVHFIPNLSPGKYSARVRSISLAGESPWSTAVEFSVGMKEDNTVVITVVVALTIFLVVCIVGYIFLRNYQKKKQQERLIASVNPDYIETKYVKDNWEVPRENLEVGEPLGLGNFGMVYKGILNGTMPVAIKTIPENYTEEDKNEFLNEASVMKNFSTFHIIKLLGVVSEGCPPFVVMELMEFGDLKSYLRKIREKDKTLDVPRVIRMAGEIADGMAYLESKKFIHRDLAARNCMISKDLVCKIGDFGMARDIYETDYYKIGQKGLLPIRWMAPENLSDGVFTSDSDVWSFGIVLYEIITMGEMPYQGFSNDEVLNHVLRKGTVSIPRNCPEIILKLIEKCLKWRPNERPTFIEIVSELEPFLAQDFCEKSFYHSEEGVEIRNSGMKKVYHHAAQIRFHWGTETARWVREFEDNVTLLDQTRAGTSRGRIFKNGFQHLGYLAAMEDVPLDR